MTSVALLSCYQLFDIWEFLNAHIFTFSFVELRAGIGQSVRWPATGWTDGFLFLAWADIFIFATRGCSEANHSPPYDVEVKNARSLAATRLCFHRVMFRHKDIFTFNSVKLAVGQHWEDFKDDIWSADHEFPTTDLNLLT
jgi:hypothetical protein